MKKRFITRRTSRTDINEGGQDSFLDIVSNIVGILIILVMIAGAQVGAVHPQENSQENPQKNQEESMSHDSSQITAQDQQEYITVCEKFIADAENVKTLKEDVSSLNSQLALVRQQAEGTEEAQSRMALNAASIKATLELVSEKKDAQEKEKYDQQKYLNKLDETLQELQRTKQKLESNVKKIELENVPSQLGKKVEGHEGFFAIRHGRISHVPMNVFSERLRSYFKKYNPYNKNSVDDKFGPIDNYYFHFQASVHKHQEADGVAVSVRFDYGECIPENDSVGELCDAALQNNSIFMQKLALYLQSTSTITLFVYPDSFNELRDVKKYLMNQGYNIALRPMPANQEIIFSPKGSKSTSY